MKQRLHSLIGLMRRKLPRLSLHRTSEAQIFQHLNIMLIRSVHIWGKRVLEVWYALPAKHVILVRLEHYTGESRGCTNPFGLTHRTVPRREPPLQNIRERNLKAVNGRPIEIKVVNVNDPKPVKVRRVFRDNIRITEVVIFGRLGADTEHTAHRSPAANIGVFPHKVNAGRVSRKNAPKLPVYLPFALPYNRTLVTVLLIHCPKLRVVSGKIAQNG